MALIPRGMSSPGGGATAGRGGVDDMSEDDDDDKKPAPACPVTPHPRPPSQVFALDPDDTRLRSSGGPGTGNVSGGILAESMRREAHAASRCGEGMLRKETVNKLMMMLVSLEEVHKIDIYLEQCSMV
jgi:hypothetical protein